MKLNPTIIKEASLPLWDFVYPGYETDPSPKIIVLGSYVHPNTENTLIMGINVRLLDTMQATKMVNMINDLTKIKNGRIRTKYLKTRAKDIFDTAYRTYDLKKITGLNKSTVNGKGPTTEVPKTPKAQKDKAERATSNELINKSVNVSDKSVTPDIKLDDKQEQKKDRSSGAIDKSKSDIDIVNKKPNKLSDIYKSIDDLERPLGDDGESGAIEEVPKEVERSERRLGQIPKGYERHLQRYDSPVSGVEDEEYRPV